MCGGLGWRSTAKRALRKDAPVGRGVRVCISNRFLRVSRTVSSEARRPTVRANVASDDFFHGRAAVARRRSLRRRAAAVAMFLTECALKPYSEELRVVSLELPRNERVRVAANLRGAARFS